MTDTHAPEPHAYDFQEQVARIEQAQAETRKFTAETQKLIAESHKLNSDTRWAPLLVWGAFLASFATFLTVLIKS